MKLNAYERKHLSRIREGLPECMVLLKQNGQFPLSKAGMIAAYGNGVRRSVKGGTGSGEVNSRFSVNIEDGLKQAGFTVTTEEWLNEYERCYTAAKKDYRKQLKKEAKAAGVSLMMYSLGAVMPEPDYEIPLTAEGDCAIYVLSRISGEGNDRRPIPGDFLLSATEIRGILALDKKYDRFMLVLNTGGPVDLTPVADVGNILVLSQLGVEMGNALADVLLGKANPSGKLTTTWSAWTDYCPDVRFGNLDDNDYLEGIYVGYRYFDTVGKKAMFPFGYGCSYSTFEQGDEKIHITGTRVTVTARVSNTGEFPGKEVVQIYLTPPEKKLKKPYQDLVAFAKTSALAPGQSETLDLAFDLTAFASFDEEICAYVLEAGEYIVRMGSSSADTKPIAVLALDQDVITKHCRRIAPQIRLQEKSYERAARKDDLCVCPRFSIAAETVVRESAVYDRECEIDDAVTALSDEELACLGIGSFSRKGGLASVIGSASSHVAGAAGETTSALEQKGVPALVMADGPAGLRLTRQVFTDKKGVHGVGRTGVPDSVLENASGIGKLIMRMIAREVKAPAGARIREQYCTAIPVGTAIAQSWNLDYAKTCGDVVGAEMERFGVQLWLAPAMNIHRSVLCGRNFEYYSEDPVLSGLLAAAVTQGVQQHRGCGTTIKHFAANNQELNRYTNSSNVSERALREIYLKGFGICVRESQPKAVMTSYNLINGVHANEIRGLTEDYLRAENGFKGIVMTDWIVSHMASRGKYRAARADEVAKAGGDLFMPGSAKDYDRIMKALKTGKLSRLQLEANGSRIYRMIKELKADSHG